MLHPSHHCAIKTEHRPNEAKSALLCPAKAKAVVRCVLPETHDGDCKLTEIRIGDTTLDEPCADYPRSEAETLLKAAGNVCGNMLTMSSHTTPSGRFLGPGVYVPFECKSALQHAHNVFQDALAEHRSDSPVHKPWGDVDHVCIWCGEDEAEALLRRHVCGGCETLLKASRGPVDMHGTETAKTPEEIRESMLIVPKWKRIVEAAQRVDKEGPTTSALYQLKHALLALPTGSGGAT